MCAERSPTPVSVWQVQMPHCLMHTTINHPWHSLLNVWILDHSTSIIYRSVAALHVHLRVIPSRHVTSFVSEWTFSTNSFLSPAGLHQHTTVVSDWRMVWQHEGQITVWIWVHVSTDVLVCSAVELRIDAPQSWPCVWRLQMDELSVLFQYFQTSWKKWLYFITPQTALLNFRSLYFPVLLCTPQGETLLLLWLTYFWSSCCYCCWG